MKVLMESKGLVLAQDPNNYVIGTRIMDSVDKNGNVIKKIPDAKYYESLSAALVGLYHQFMAGKLGKPVAKDIETLFGQVKNSTEEWKKMVSEVTGIPPEKDIWI